MPIMTLFQYDFVYNHQQDILAEAQRNSLARAFAAAQRQDAKPPRTLRLLQVGPVAVKLEVR